MTIFLVATREVVNTIYIIEGETITEARRKFSDGDKGVDYDVDYDEIEDAEILGVYREEPDGMKTDVTEEWEQAKELDELPG
jgi:hypothetical protein